MYDPTCSPDLWRHTPQLIVTNADGAWTRGEAGSLRDILFVLADALRTNGAPHNIYRASRDMHPRNGRL